MSKQIDEMLATNAAQKRYYEVASGREVSTENSGATNLWRRLRERALGAVKVSTSSKALTPLHRQWMGDLSNLKVLELGVGTGSALSVELATAAREYIALDLSQQRIDKLAKKLAKGGGGKPRLYVADFLSASEFPEADFDIIYALSVFHHFEHFEAFLDLVDRKLAKGGRVITYDPVQIWWPIRVLRTIYRPFQTDSEWEHPFDAASLRAIEGRFDVIACQGLLTKAKWAAIMAVLAPKLGARLGQKWHADDMARSTTPRSLRRSLHASYLLRKRETR